MKWKRNNCTDTCFFEKTGIHCIKGTEEFIPLSSWYCDQTCKSANYPIVLLLHMHSYSMKEQQMHVSSFSTWWKNCHLILILAKSTGTGRFGPFSIHNKQFMVFSTIIKMWTKSRASTWEGVWKCTSSSQGTLKVQKSQGPQELHGHLWTSRLVLWKLYFIGFQNVSCIRLIWRAY